MNSALFLVLLICSAWSVDSVATAATPVPPGAVPAEKTPEELADETPAHEKFLDSLEFEGNPYRQYRQKAEDVTTTYAQCNSGLCCTKRNTFFLYGHICGNPSNPCQIAICSGQSAECYTISAKNGTSCENGSCFDGECVKDCVGECCKGHRALEDGTECTDGICVSGVCVRKCKGDCCEAGQSFAKPDGAPCDGGVCENGECQIDESKTESSTASSISAAEDAIKQPVVAVINEAESSPSALESVWSKLVGDEKAEKKEAAEKEAAKNKKAKDAETDLQVKNILQSSVDTAKETTSPVFKIVLIVAGSFVGLLLIVFIIVLIAKGSSNKSDKKKDDEKAEEAYESF